MAKIIHKNINDLATKHKSEHDGYEYIKKVVIPRNYATQSVVNVYEIPPQKSGYPFHYHLKNEETFYIISGEGVLKTNDSEEKVTTGDFLYFPANESGAHKLTNTSLTEKLIYIDFDTANDIDIALYPDSNKIGVFGKNTNNIFKLDSQVDYYKDE